VKIVLAAAAAVAALLPTSGAASVVAPAYVHARTTTWAGYVAHGHGPYTAVSAKWTEPQPNCKNGENSAASSWVGLDGYPSPTIEQIGTDADCINGNRAHAAWYEFYPDNPVYLPNPVNAGDTLKATVQVAAGKITVTLENKQKGWAFATSRAVGSAQRASAEVIVEDPIGPNGPVPLARFGSVPFKTVTVNGAPLANAAPERFVMVKGSVVRAAPSSINGGNGFVVTWKHN
jgi:hypothetical protein